MKASLFGLAMLVVATDAWTPPQVRPARGSALRPLHATAASLATMLPAAALAAEEGGAGINGAFKAAVADALGPDVAAAAPIIGSVLFVGIAAADMYSRKGNSDAAEASAPEPEAASEPSDESAE